MSIRLIDQYPNRVDPTSADYPHGEPRNKTAPDATDGTPYEEAWYKDQEGYFQGLIEAAGITPSGNPDTVPDSDYLAALVQVASGVTEIDVGGSNDVTLDYNQSRINALRLTGALAADVDLIVPDTERIYLIINETSGSFNVTVRTSGGTGVVVKDSVDQVRSDGTDVVRAIVTEVKNNFEATSAPTATDDETDGYSVGSIWIDVSADQPYICVDAKSTGAGAIWQNFSYQIADQSEAEAGTNNTELMTPERTKQAIEANIEVYRSAEQSSLSEGSMTTLAHGLSGQPDQVMLFMVCKTAEGGYDVGDYVQVQSVQASFNNNNDQGFGTFVTANNTNAYITIGTSWFTNSSMYQKNNSSFFIPTSANWNFVVKAVKFNV